MSWECRTGVNENNPHCKCNLYKDNAECCYCHRPISAKRMSNGQNGVWAEEPDELPRVSWNTVSIDIETPTNGYWTSTDPYIVSASNPSPNLTNYFKEMFTTRKDKERVLVQEDTCDDDGSEENIDYSPAHDCHRWANADGVCQSCGQIDPTYPSAGMLKEKP